MDKEKLSQFLEDMIDALTIRRVALLALLATITIVMIAVFENRTALFAAAVTNTVSLEKTIEWDLGQESRSQLIGLTRLSFVGAVLVTDVNLKKNRRTTKFYYFQDPELSKNVSKVLDSLLPETLFDFDAKNTEQMVAMLNNEFRCYQFKDTALMRFLPELVKPFPYICRLAIPPFFGEYAGFVTIFLTKQPKPEEYDSLKLEMNRVSIELYVRDIAKRPPQ